jgi:DNA-binding PadR family transcriptional regulator
METSIDTQSQLPLTEPTYFILLSLAPGPNHGYAIMKDVFELSQGRVTLSTGTLYTALKRLLESGWIARADGTAKGNGNGNRQRKAYNLTQLGEHILQAEVQRLEGLVFAAQLRSIGNTP